MKTLLKRTFAIAVCALSLLSVAPAQAPNRPDTSIITIVTAGDVTITKANGKTAVVINFGSGRATGGDTRITILGPYSLDANGGVKEVKGPQGIELHVMSHEELRLEAPEIAEWEHTHKFTEYTACSKIPAFPACGHPVCDQFGHPKDQCRYNSESGCACVAPGGGPCTDTAKKEKHHGAEWKDALDGGGF
ncbi:MAG TPA: hypothetical protein VMI10_17080 [Terriglobales bacterium]|nr:hypothetical protein [Terriglobales bacterium]